MGFRTFAIAFTWTLRSTAFCPISTARAFAWSKWHIYAALTSV